MQIEIDFELFKTLTAMRESERVSLNDVIRRLAKLPVAATVGVETGDDTPSGYMASGRHLPNGTALRADYKGTEYSAEIVNGRIVSKGGKLFNSLSAAAKDITKNNVNGLRFWKAKRPSDEQWILVAGIPKKAPRL